jgi:uncharacterized membrane protein YccC
MLLQIITLLLAIPAGYLIAYLTPEELKDGEKYFKTIIIISFLAGIWFYLTGHPYVSWTSGFIIIVTFISLNKSR